MLATIIAVVFLAFIVAPFIVITLLHFADDGPSARRRLARVQQLHDLAVQRRDAGELPDLDPALFHERDARLDQMSARYPREQQLPAEQRDLYHLLTLDELDELIGL